MSDDPDPGRIEGLAHVLAVRVYYEDTDFTGFVYHARYLQFLERGRTDFLRVIGVGHAGLLARPEPLAFAVRRMTLEFEKPARIDDALVVRTRFSGASGARLHVSQEIARGEERLLTAEVEAVCMSLDGRPRRPPTDVAGKLAPYLEPQTG
jgi:acyl-CoA thioester hydrolase